MEEVKEDEEEERWRRENKERDRKRKLSCTEMRRKERFKTRQKKGIE